MSDKYALVTGSAQGIGRSIAEVLSKDGYNIFVHYRNEKRKAEDVASVIESNGVKVHIIRGDLTVEEDRKNIVEKVGEVTDHLDVLVNNVGFDFGHMIEEYSLEDIQYTINVNLTQKILMTQYFLPLLKKSENPSIVNIASRMGKEKTIETIGIYGPAEAGVIKFTQCCALEFRDYNIRVNCVAPGLTRTGLTETFFTSEEEWDEFGKSNPRHRVGLPIDVANTVSFLVSDKADYINGETIGVNGGSNLG